METLLIVLVLLTGIWSGMRLLQVHMLGRRLMRVRAVNNDQQRATLIGSDISSER